MTKNDIAAKIGKLFNSLQGNILTQKDGIKKKYAGIRMFDAPIVGIGSADDAP